MASKLWGSRPTRTGYNGMFGDSFFSDCWDIVDRPASRSSFGKSAKIINEDVTNDVPEDKIKPMFRKSHLSRQSSDDIYQVMLEVSHFTPSDLSVKLVDEKTVVVEGKHGERKDPQGFVSREFTRKYNLPESVKPSSVECYLSADGVLVIRGHADRPKTPSSPSHHLGHTTELDTTIPIFTQGYHTQQQQQQTKSQKERIIPITHEDRYEVTEPPASGRSSRSSTKDPTPIITSEAEELQSVQTNNKNSYGKREQKERTVSFSEEEESISYDQSYHNSRASTSKASNKATSMTIPVNVVTSPSPTPTPMQTEEIHEEVLGRSSRMSTEEGGERMRSPIGSTYGHPDHEEVFHNGFDTATSLMDRRRRHFSSNKDSMDSDRFFSSRLGHMDRLVPSFSTRGEDIFDDFGLDLSSRWPELRQSLPVKNREEKYEKTFEKAVKNGHLTETLAERFYSEQFSSSLSNKNNHDQTSKNNSSNKEYNKLHGNPMEHRINISSPA